MAQRIAAERQRRELQPIHDLTAKYGKLEGPKAEVQEFQRLLRSIQEAADFAAKMLDLFSRTGLSALLTLLK